MSAQVSLGSQVQKADQACSAQMAHVKEFDQNANAKNPENPIFFTKATTSIIGPDEEIDSHPAVTQEVDYEGELGVIIGKRGTNIAEEEGATEQQIDEDFRYLTTLWRDILKRFETAKAPCLLYEELDLPLRAVRGEATLTRRVPKVHVLDAKLKNLVV